MNSIDVIREINEADREPVLEYMHNCGSFAVNGYHGASNDYLTHMFVLCSRSAHPDDLPDEVRFGHDVGERFLVAWDRAAHRPPGVRPSLYGAKITFSGKLGCVEFFRDGVLVGETTGWTA